MSPTILQRIYAIADASTKSGDGTSVFSQLASVARKLASDDDAAAKAHTIVGIITKLAPADQERLVAAIEGLAK